ncbi:hypothetical protein EV175_005086, partial [Coemansia sp. RSA 1933]
MSTQKQRDNRGGSTPLRNTHISDTENITPRAGVAVSQEKASTAAKSIDRLQQHQTGRVASLAMSGNIASLGTSDCDSAGGRNDTDDMDAIWDELDNMELDSQTMRQLTETEEQFYATQQFVESMDLALSQEFTEPQHDGSTSGRTVTRCTSADAGPSHGSRVVSHGPSTRSVPVTPSAQQSICISDSDSSGYPSVEKVLSRERGAVGTARDRSGSLKYTSQQHHHQQQQTSAHSNTRMSMSSSRGKVNLYHRLAQHIPPRPEDDRAASSKPSLALQQPHPKRHKPELLSISTSLNSPMDIDSSTLTPPSSRPNYQLQTHGADQSGYVEEIERLRAENEHMRAETDQLKAQLYTKDGEVRIVRDSLSRTEINYTQLQEQLANQKSKSEAEYKLVKGKLQSEIDRLKTEMFFHQQEAQMVAISASGTTSATQTPNAIKRSSTTERNASASAKPTSSRAMEYPTMEDFSSPPNQTNAAGFGAMNRTAPDTPTPKTAATRAPPAPQPNTLNSVTHQTNSTLLEMLQSVVDQSDAEFSDMVSLSIQLFGVARNPSATQIDVFQSSVCRVLTKLAQDASYRQLAAVVRLLLQALTSLDDFCAIWLHDSTIYEAGDQKMMNLPSSSTVGNQRLCQLASVLNFTLRTTIRATPMRQSAGSKGTTDFAMAVSLQCKLISRLISAQPEAALGDNVWKTFDPCLETTPLLTPSLNLEALVGVLELVTVLIQVSLEAWRFVRSAPGNFEQFLLATTRRLQRAFAENDDLVLDGERSLLVLIASAIVTHEDDTHMLVNGMKRFTTALVQWFIDERQALTTKHKDRRHSHNQQQLDGSRRLQVFFEYTKCLNVVLSEVDDVAELLGGDNSPLFFAFVATCTRMSIGEGAFAELSSMRELAADLLAYVVTEEQAQSIQ